MISHWYRSYDSIVDMVFFCCRVQQSLMFISKKIRKWSNFLNKNLYKTFAWFLPLAQTVCLFKRLYYCYKKRGVNHFFRIIFYINYSAQGCHTLREFRVTQGIFKLKKISGKLRETQGISGNSDLFFKLRETQESFDFF